MMLLQFLGGNTVWMWAMLPALCRSMLNVQGSTGGSVTYTGLRGRKSSVGIETGYVLDGRSSIPTRGSCG